MTDLVRYDAACRAIAEAKSVDEVKDIRDKAAAMQAYARMAKNTDMEADAAEIRLRAERRVGEMIDEQKKTVGLNTGSRGRRVSEKPTLANSGVDKNLANKARTLGAMSSKQFEDVVDKTRQAVNRAAKGVINKQTKKERRDSRELGVAESLPDGICGIGVEDFEWDQETWSEAGRSKHASNTYETATDAHTAEEIVARTEERMRCMATDHALLFMFVTIPHLAVGIDVLRLRGYRYVSNIVWGKEDHLGTGYWVREKHEQLLIGVRGNKIPAPLPGTQLDSLVMAPKPNSAHSSKPDVFYDWIRQTYPNITKVEFNRRGPARPGWLAHGNEAEPNET
jgi:N6-adenosine-specific RNA methylase IME4